MAKTLDISMESPCECDNKNHITIQSERCKGCYLCIEACPRGLIEVGQCLNEAGYYAASVKDTDECTACALCWQVCPDVAIEVYRAQKEAGQ